MSELLVEICEVLDVQKHPNADKLDIIKIKGWDVIVQKDTIIKNDLVIFIPPDSILPESLHTYLNITQYCGQLPTGYFKEGEKPTERRVKATKIRGTSSYGTIMTLDSFTDYYYKITNNSLLPMYLGQGVNLVNELNITKYNPPIKSTQGDVERDHPLFHRYTDIENWRNYPDIFRQNEMVRITCKIHGTNCRLGLISHPQPDDNKNIFRSDLKFMAGSHKTNRKQYDNNGKKCLYWEPFDWYPGIKDILRCLSAINYPEPIIIFGEIFGSGIQDLTYGMTNGQKDFAIFDIMVGDKYLPWDLIGKYCERFEVPMVSAVYIGPYDKDIVEKHTNGPSIPALTGKFKEREGIVITPLEEREDPTIGRVILKSINVNYLNR